MGEAKRRREYRANQNKHKQTPVAAKSKDPTSPPISAASQRGAATPVVSGARAPRPRFSAVIATVMAALTGVFH